MDSVAPAHAGQGRQIGQPFSARAQADLKVCIKAGILPNQNIDTAIDMFIGTTSEAIRIANTQKRPKDYPRLIATMILTALGMEASKAAEVARRPLPISMDQPDQRR